MKQLWTDAWTELNFCSVCIRRNRSIAGFRRQNITCEFSARLLSQRFTSWACVVADRFEACTLAPQAVGVDFGPAIALNKALIFNNFWRSDGDSNPGQVALNTLSRRAP